MRVTISQQFKDAINSMPYNKTVKRNALKIYAALYSKEYLKNNHGYFPVASDYLKSVNVRYFKIIDYFEERGLIDVYKRAVQDDDDIFNTKYKKYYDTSKGICMKYRFLVPIVGQEVEVDMITDSHNRWYEIVENSLLETGFDTKITRDNFGRRVWHPAIRNYKEDFSRYYTIDAVCSQPRILYNLMKDRDVLDEEYNKIFENDLDFYYEIMYKLKLEDREEAKHLFLHWLNGNGYVPNFGIHSLFPVASKFLKKVKKGNFKNSSSLLQRLESSIWIDDLLNNIPCDFALPVHDCVIVKEEDVDKVLEYCRVKYPNIKFEKELISKKKNKTKTI